MAEKYKQIFVITKSYTVPAISQQLIDIVAIFKDKKRADKYWHENCEDREGYKFDIVFSDLV